ncbi:MAG: hypothetical protein RLZZ387_4558 [Chloroflexota bacterium]
MTTDEGLRHIRLEGAFNVRDVGGYTTRDGQPIRWRRLLRADSLHRLPPNSQRALLDYGLGTIIDLRRPSEVARDPNVLASVPGVIYHNLPVLLDDDGERIEIASQTPGDLYMFMVEEQQPQLAAIMASLAVSQAPALVHCYVGKDRTGVVVALALGAAGVPHETIAEDYALSEELLAPLMAEIRVRRLQLGLDVDRFDRLTGSPYAAMLGVLEHLEARYSGVRGYLETIGLTPAQIERLRQLLVE